MLAEVRRAQVARLTLEELCRADVTPAAIVQEAHRRRRAGAASDEELLELFEALLTRDKDASTAADRARYLREYVLLLVQLSNADGQLLQRKTRAGTVPSQEDPQALAAVIGTIIQEGGTEPALRQLLAATCAKDPSIASAYALLLNKSPFAQLVADLWPTSSAGREFLSSSLIGAVVVDQAACQTYAEATLHTVMRTPDTPVAEKAASIITTTFDSRWCDVLALELPALALRQLRSESGQYVLETSRMMNMYASAVAANDMSLQQLLGLAFLAWPCVSLEFAGWELHNSKATLGEVWRVLTSHQLRAYGSEEELEAELLQLQSHQWWSQYSRNSFLALRYFFQALQQRDSDSSMQDWLACITVLSVDEALLWLLSMLTFTCALANKPESPVWTTAEHIRLVFQDLLEAVGTVIQREQVQAVRVFPHVMLLASMCATSSSPLSVNIVHALFEWLPSLAGHKLATKQVWQTILGWLNSGSEVHCPLGLHGLAKMAQLGPDMTAQAVEHISRIRPFQATQMSTTPLLQAVAVKVAWLNAVAELTKHVSDDDDATKFIDDVQLALKDQNAEVGAAAVRCLKAFIDQDMIDLTAVYRIICKPSNTTTLDSDFVQVELAKFCGYVEIKEESDDDETGDDGEDGEPGQEAKQEETGDEVDEEILKLREAYQVPLSHLVVALEHRCLDVRKAAAVSLAAFPAPTIIAQEEQLVLAVRRAIMRCMETEADTAVLDAVEQAASALIHQEIEVRVNWRDARTADGRLQSSLRDSVSNKTIAAIPRRAQLQDTVRRALSDAECHLQLLSGVAGEELSFETLRLIVEQQDPTARLRSEIMLQVQLAEYGHLLSRFARLRFEQLMSELKRIAASSPAAVSNICDAFAGFALQLRYAATTPNQCIQIFDAYRECRALLPNAADLQTETIFRSAISANWLKSTLEAGFELPDGGEMLELFRTQMAAVVAGLRAHANYSNLVAAAETMRVLNRCDLPPDYASTLTELRELAATHVLQAMLHDTSFPMAQLQPLLNDMELSVQGEVVLGGSPSHTSPIGLVAAMDAWLSSLKSAAHKQAMMHVVLSLATKLQPDDARQRSVLVIVCPVLVAHCHSAGVNPPADMVRVLLGYGAEQLTASIDQSLGADAAVFDDLACAFAWQFGSLLRFASTHAAVVWETLTKSVQLLLRATSSAAAGSGCQTGALFGLSAALAPVIDGSLSNALFDASSLFSSRLLDRPMLQAVLPAFTQPLEAAGVPNMTKLFASRALIAIGKLQQGATNSGPDSFRYLGAVPVASVLVPAEDGMLSAVLGGVTQALIGQHLYAAEEQQRRTSYVTSCLRILATGDLRDGFHSASLCDALISSGGTIDARTWSSAFAYAGLNFARSKDMHYALTMRRICNLTHASEFATNSELLHEMATHLPSMCRSLSTQQTSALVLEVLERIVLARPLREATVVRFLAKLGDLFAGATDAAARAQLEEQLAAHVIRKFAQRAETALSPSSFARVLHAAADFAKSLQAETISKLADSFVCNLRADGWVALALLKTQPVQVQRRWCRRWLSVAVSQGALEAVQGLAQALKLCEWQVEDQLGIVTDVYLAAAGAVASSSATEAQPTTMLHRNERVHECLAHLTAVVLAAQLKGDRQGLWPTACTVPFEALERVSAKSGTIFVQLRSLLSVASQAIEWHCKDRIPRQGAELAMLILLCRSLHECLAHGAPASERDRVLAEVSKFVLLLSSPTSA